MFKIKATDLGSALECATVGGGVGFVLMVSPECKDIGGGKKAQFASISSSDGDKTGVSNVVIHTTDMKEAEIYYATASLRSAVTTLSKITDFIYIESKGSHLLVSDEKRESEIKVALMEKDVILPIPNGSKGTTIFTIEKEKFVDAIRFGGYAAEDSNTVGFEQIGFLIDKKEDSHKLIVLSKKSVMACKAEVPIVAVQVMEEEKVEDAEDAIVAEQVMEEEKAKDEWHMMNYKFVQSMVQKLMGDMLQIAFTEKFMVVMTKCAVFGCKKSESPNPGAFMKLFERNVYDYSGTVDKKELLLGIEVATVGVNGKAISLETNENGTLKVYSEEGNKSNVIQKSYKGKMETKSFVTEHMKLVLKGCGDVIHYQGEAQKPGKKPPVIVLDGKVNEVEFMSVLMPVNKK